jgi:hypothetical protein
VRERTWGEFFYEKLIAWPETLAKIENEARAAIAHAFDPYMNQALLAFESPEALPSEYDEISSANEVGKAVLRVQRMLLQRLQAAVLESKPELLPFDHQKIKGMQSSQFAQQVELMAVNGLRKIPPGVSVNAFSPLTFMCNFLVVSKDLPKSSEYSRSDTLKRAKKAFEGVSSMLCRRAGDGGKLTRKGGAAQMPEYLHVVNPPSDLTHAEHLWILKDHGQLKSEGFDAASADANHWKNFYDAIFCKAARTRPHGSMVLEPCPSYCMPALDGIAIPVFTRANLQGLAQALRKAMGLEGELGWSINSVMVTIPDADTRGEFEKLMQESDSASVKRTASSGQGFDHKAMPKHKGRQGAAFVSSASAPLDGGDSADGKARGRQIIVASSEESFSTSDYLAEDEA